MNEIKTVCVYCASSTKIAPGYFEAARELGETLAKAGIRIVNGAGNIGLMGALSDAALAVGGKVVGVIPHFMVEQGWCHTGLTEVIEVNDMHTRKQTMAQLADAVIALPLEIITWKQLGLYLNPIVILNIKGYFDPLLAMFDRAVAENFMRPAHAAMWAVADNAAEALRLIRTQPISDPNVRKHAKI